MKVPVNSSSINNKLSLTLALWLGLVTVFGLSSCGGSGSNDPEVTSPELTVSLPTVIEGDTGTIEMIFSVTLSKAIDQTLTVDYTTTDETATVADNDYTAVSGSLTIPAGSTTANVSVYANGDTDFEEDETFSLVVSNIQGATLGETSYSGQGLISNDDTADSGYFAGTATLNSTDYIDLTALVYDQRILLFSPSANVQYDIDMTSYDGTDYSGTVEVYVDGQIEQVGLVEVAGQTIGGDLTGSFSNGTGFGSGSFAVAYDLDNNKGAGASTSDFSRIEALSFNRWTGNLFGIDVDTGLLSVNGTGTYQGTDEFDNWCVFSYPTIATFNIPDPEINIYQMSHPIESPRGGTCESTYASTGHTGFTSVIDDDDASDGGDDKLLFAFNNGNIALFGIMYRP